MNGIRKSSKSGFLMMLATSAFAGVLGCSSVRPEEITPCSTGECPAVQSGRIKSGASETRYPLPLEPPKDPSAWIVNEKLIQVAASIQDPVEVNIKSNNNKHENKTIDGAQHMYVKSLFVFDKTEEHNEKIEEALDEVLIFLLDEFGSPPKTNNKINIKTDDIKTNHAVTFISPNGDRTININLSNIAFSESRDHLTHEVFHALFQTENWLQESEREVESWASYAQFRFKYKGKKNSEIYAILSDIVNNMEKTNEFNINNSWSLLDQNQKIKAYITNSMFLFSKKETDNYQLYREKIEKDNKKQIKQKTNEKNIQY